LKGLIRQPLVRRGVGGAVVMLSCLGLLVVLTVPPFEPADESAHAGYALEVVDGRIPRMDETVEVELPGQRPTRYYLANHPPLYYAIVGPVLERGLLSGHPIAAIRLTRLFSLALGAVTVALTAAFAGMMSAKRRVETMVLAAGLAASVPVFVTTSAALHNDLLGVLAADVAFVGAVAALVGRPSAWAVASVCLGASVTMATRFNGLGLVGLACLGLAVAVLLRTSGSPPRRQLGHATLLGALPALCVLVTSGWFYLRNIRLYGDVTGVGYNRELLGRVDNFTPWSYLTDRQTFPELLTRAEGGGPWVGLPWFGWYDRKLLFVALIVLGGGLLLGAARAAGMLRSGQWRRALGGSDEEPTRDLLARLTAWGLAIGVPVLTMVQLSGFVAQTGSPNPRYLLPALPVIALVVAMACRSYPGRSTAIVGTAIVGLQAALTVTTTARWINQRTGAQRTDPLDQLHDSLALADVPAPSVVLGLLLAGAAAGVLLQFSALWSASATRPSTSPDSTASVVAVVTPAPLSAPTSSGDGPLPEPAQPVGSS
jgi:hypothetical protein